MEYKHLPLDGHEVSDDPKRTAALLGRFCQQVSDLLDVSDRLCILGVDTVSFGYNSQGDFLIYFWEGAHLNTYSNGLDHFTSILCFCVKSGYIPELVFPDGYSAGEDVLDPRGGVFEHRGDLQVLRSYPDLLFVDHMWNDFVALPSFGEWKPQSYPLSIRDDMWIVSHGEEKLFSFPISHISAYLQTLVVAHMGRSHEDHEVKSLAQIYRIVCEIAATTSNP